MTESHRDEIAKLESLYAMNPEGRVFTHLAEAYRKAGELERAREILRDGLQRHPDYASAHVVLGRVLGDSGEEDAAGKEFRRVLELDRHNLIALRSLGDLAVAGGRTDEALHYYGELAVLDPTDSAIQERLNELRAAKQEAGEPSAVAAGEPESAVAAVLPAPAEGEGLPAGRIEEELVSEAEPPPGFETTGLATDLGGATEAPGESAEEPAGPAAPGVEIGEPEEPEWSAVEPGRAEDGVEGGVEAETLGIELESAAEGEGITEIEADEVVIEAGAEFEETPALAAESLEDVQIERVGDEEPVVEGRWETPATMAADLDLERSRSPDAGEWIPEDRWEWVSASAGEAGAGDETAAGLGEEEEEAIEDFEPEEIAEPEWLAEVGPEDALESAEEADLEIGPEPVESSAAEAAGVAEDVSGESALEAIGAELEPGSEAETAEPEPAVVVVEGEEAGEWPAGEDDSGDQVITETLAEIYASQGLLDRAAAVYRRLVRDHPDDERLTDRLSEIEARAGWGGAEAESPEAEAGSLETEPAGEVGDDREAWLARVESAWTGGEGATAVDDSPYAWPSALTTADEADGAPVGDYFRALLSWRPQSAAGGAPETELPEVPAADTVNEDWPAGSMESTEAESGTGGDREGEEDLEMFRTWLKSLKK